MDWPENGVVEWWSNGVMAVSDLQYSITPPFQFVP
jgi:hypothetical protein